MKLLQVTLATPIRDENHKIYKWESRPVLLNPRNIESAGYVEEIDKVQLLLASGRNVPIQETLAELSKRFEAATA